MIHPGPRPWPAGSTLKGAGSHPRCSVTICYSSRGVLSRAWMLGQVGSGAGRHLVMVMRSTVLAGWHRRHGPGREGPAAGKRAGRVGVAERETRARGRRARLRGPGDQPGDRLAGQSRAATGLVAVPHRRGPGRRDRRLRLPPPECRSPIVSSEASGLACSARQRCRSWSCRTAINARSGHGFGRLDGPDAPCSGVAY